jgi:ABC-2 type transport system permease protein
MNLWRLEWFRLVRTRSALALGGVFLFFGLMGPLAARYMDVILGRFAGDIQVTLPPPTPISGLEQYMGNVVQIGLLVVLAVAASALSFDNPPERAAFYRSRVRRVRTLVAPRYGMVTLAAFGAFALGTAGAWYETVILLGELPVGRMLLGTGLVGLYLAFAVAVTALAASIMRGVLAVVPLAAGLLIAVPLLGLLAPIRSWLPSMLLGALTALPAGVPFGEFVRPALVTVLATAALLAIAVVRLERREL